MNSSIPPNETQPAGSLPWGSEDQDLRWSLYVCYIVFGAPAVLSNLLILFIIVSNQQLRSKSAMITGLAGGNIFNGMHALGYGIMRIPMLRSGTIDALDQNIWLCMATLLPVCMMLGSALPASMQLVAGIERLMAIGAFNWYRTRWSSKRNWLAVLGVYVVNSIVWISALLASVYRHRNVAVTRECSSTSIIGTSILGPMFLFIVVSGCCGVTCLMIAVITGRRRAQRFVGEPSGPTSSENSRFRNQYRLSKVMLLIALCDLLLVVIPNLLVIIRVHVNSPITSMAGVYGILAYCLNSTINVLIYLCMNKEFRKIACVQMRSFWRCENSVAAS